MLKRTVSWSRFFWVTHNICFGLEIRKFIFKNYPSFLEVCYSDDIHLNSLGIFSINVITTFHRFLLVALRFYLHKLNYLKLILDMYHTLGFGKQKSTFPVFSLDGADGLFFIKWPLPSMLKLGKVGPSYIIWIGTNENTPFKFPRLNTAFRFCSVI